MKIEHIAIWVDDLEKMRQFYTTYFNMSCGEKYVNPKKQYASYFLSSGPDQSRLELMQRPDIGENTGKRGFTKGLAHLSFSLGSKEGVNQLTECLRKANYTVASEPRTTGDGYYESAVLDPEGNYIELLA